MKIALVIFTKNEKKNCEYIFNKIPFHAVNKTYIIDGNSIDGTRKFWQSKKIKVFSQRYPGVGGAYESAFGNTKEDCLIFFHPDGNMDPEAILKFVSLLRKGVGFIIASRMIKKAINEEDDQLIKSRKWFCQGLGKAANTFWGNKEFFCTDITQGYRAFSRSVYNKLGIKIPNAIAPDYEQVIRALKLKIKITEFPTKEGKRVFNETSMRSLKTGWENIKVLLNELSPKNNFT